MLYSAKWMNKENISLEIKHLYLKIKNRKLYKVDRNNGKRAKLKKKKECTIGKKQQNWKTDRPLERVIKKNYMPTKKLKREHHYGLFKC